MSSPRYLRIRVEDQLEAYSLEAQFRDFLEFCSQKNWEVVETYSESIDKDGDENESGWIFPGQ